MSTSLAIYIKPGLQPTDRHDIEDKITDALGEAVVDFLGGGTMMGEESESDFSMLIDGLSEEKILENCRSVLSPIEFTQPTTIRVVIDDRETIL